MAIEGRWIPGDSIVIRRKPNFCAVCDQYMPEGEPVKRVEFVRRGKRDWGHAHPGCADREQINLDDSVNDVDKWLYGTQRQCVEFLHNNPGITVLVSYEASRPQTSRYWYRIQDD